MKKFLNKNKFVIAFFAVIITISVCFYGIVFGATYEVIDFEYGKVTASCLNVRCGPGVSYSRVGRLYNGEYVNVFAKVGNWYIIQTSSNLVGAVSADYIEAIYDEDEILTAIESIEEQNSQEEITESEQEEVTKTEQIDELQEDTQTSSTSIQDIINNNLGEYADSGDLTEEEQTFLDLINANRINNGYSELAIDSTLQNIARLKAQDLVEQDYFSHNSEKYGTLGDMLLSFGIEAESYSENIAGNQNLAGAVEAWMNSESHKANILSNTYNYTGVAVVESDLYGKIYVEVFAKL